MENPSANASRLEISLSPEHMRYVREKVGAGEFASESDLVQRALDILRSDELERERWEREELIPAYDEAMTDPSSLLSAEQVRQALEAARLVRQKAS